MFQYEQNSFKVKAVMWAVSKAYIKADIFHASSPDSMCLSVYLRGCLCIFSSALSVRLDVIFLSGRGHYRLLNPAVQRSSPSFTKPFNDGGLPVGGGALSEDSCVASLLAKPSQPRALMSIWPPLRSKWQYNCLCVEGMILRQLNSETTDLFSVILKD